MSNKKFSLDEFKKWMRTQEDNETPKMGHSLVGIMVEPKISQKRIIEQIIAEEGVPQELAHDFDKNGGSIVEINGNDFLIQVSSGSFYIPRTYVKRS